MFTTQPAKLNSRTQRGQSIVVALLVLLLLGLAGALFVTIIARNLINANHANRVETADTYAAAGITYADSQLSNSVDGADWRPPLQFQLATANLPTDVRELARYNAAVTANALPLGNPSDPDLEYLQAGYARYNTGAGRYLVRVTYDPVNVGTNKIPLTVPPGKYLKIESIGREGVINSLDPTTYTNNRSTDRTQAYQVAYKPIGITDYARFRTNPDKRSDIANLGVASQFYSQNTDGGIATPGVSDFNSTGSAGSTGSNGTPPTIQEYPVVTTYGAADAYLYKAGTAGPFQVNPNAGSGTPVTGYTFAPGGGSLHANMTTRFFGTNVIYLNVGATYPLYQDTAEIGGDLLLDSYDAKSSLDNTKPDNSGSTLVGQTASLILNPVDITKLTATPIAAKPAMPIPPATPTAPAMPPMNTYVAPSNASGTQAFDTFGGLVRDSSAQNDPEGLPRSITRLEPPAVDAQDNASQMPRYRAIAMNSAPRVDPASTATPPADYPAGSSQYGYGKAIYVNNPNDIQPDSSTIGGGSTLTDEWLHRTAALTTGTSKGGWNGLFYNPPGVNITLGVLITPANGNTPAVYGIRLTRSAGDQFANPDGSANGGTEMDIKYSDLDRDANGNNLDTTDPTGAISDKDIIIYAEGNVRVHGIASPDEGTPASQSATPRKATTIPRHITIASGGTVYIEGNVLKGDPDSTISLLAHDYVCINTTQFLAGTNVEDRTDGIQNPELPDSGDTLSLDASHSLLQEFNFGLTGADTPATKYPNSPLALYIAAGPAGPGSTTADIDILDSTNTSVLQAPPVAQNFGSLAHLTFDLSNSSTTLLKTPTTANAFFNALGTDLFHLSISKDPGTEDANGAVSLTDQDVALERVAVLPMDIRIEAVLFAQTGSFFVIPGEWFNTNSSDNLTTYLTSYGNGSGTRPDFSGLDSTTVTPGTAAYASLSRFPMYGQPIDLKITIDGSVSEAHPADIAAQTAWMQKWGWIPQYHGSLVVSSVGGNNASTTLEPAGHTLANQPAIGLQIIYDPQAGYPYDPQPAGAATTPYYLRSDQYGRPLPFTPKLPVSTGLLYSGQSGEAPLLQ